MPRGSRTENYSECNHILVQGIGGEDIFSLDAYKDYFIKCVVKAKAYSGIKLFCYVIMKNHSHFIVRSDNVKNLAKFMSKLSISYARYYNAVNLRLGKVFDNRYISQPIDSTDKLINCITFIHNNPCKLGICENPSDYAYSSLQLDKILDLDILNEKLNLYSKEQIKYFSEYKDFHWEEDENSIAENIDLVLKELLVKYNISNRAMLWDEDNLYLISIQLMKRCKLSIRKIAEKLQIGRETLRKIIKNREKSEILS